MILSWVKGGGDMSGFENLEVWKRSMRLSVEVYKYFAKNNDYGFKDQITRSSLSIPSNIAEGSGRSTKKDNINFLYYSSGSCAELRTQIYIGMKIEYIEADTGNRWISESKEISKMLHGLIKSLKPPN